MTPAVVTVTPHPALDWTLSVPNFSAGAVHRAETQRTNAGGKGVNVAARLAEMGVAVVATGYLGADNAAAFDDLFERTGIVDRFVRIQGANRVSVKIVDPGGGTTDVNTQGASPSLADRNALADELGGLLASKPTVVLAGSLPPGIPSTAYSGIVETLRQQGCRVVLDTSGEALAAALDASGGMLPHVVKPNQEELERTVGSSLPDLPAMVRAAREVVARGAELVVVSRGAEGGLFVTRDRVVEARTPEVAVGSTVGAGDALVAGIVAAGLLGLDLDATARRATAVALRWVARDQASVGEWERSIEVRHRTDVE